MSSIILASTSPYRKELLDRLGINFFVIDPGVEEISHVGEPFEQKALRLAREKALAVATKYLDDVVIIGSDQVGVCDNIILHKPITQEKSLKQLMLISGRSLVFYTAVVCYCSKKQEIFERLDRTKVQMLPFSEQEALAYLDKEPEALKCAGSVKTESLGMSLIDHIETKDPTALIGLPMLSLIKIFRQIGISLL